MVPAQGAIPEKGEYKKKIMKDLIEDVLFFAWPSANIIIIGQFYAQSSTKVVHNLGLKFCLDVVYFHTLFGL